MQALTMCVCTLATDLISPAADILFLCSLHRKMHGKHLNTCNQHVGAADRKSAPTWLTCRLFSCNVRHSMRGGPEEKPGSSLKGRCRVWMYEYTFTQLDSHYTGAFTHVCLKSYNILWSKLFMLKTKMPGHAGLCSLLSRASSWSVSCIENGSLSSNAVVRFWRNDTWLSLFGLEWGLSFQTLSDFFLPQQPHHYGRGGLMRTAPLRLVCFCRTASKLHQMLSPCGLWQRNAVPRNATEAKPELRLVMWLKH